MTSKIPDAAPIKLSWQATEVLRVLKTLKARPGMPIERDTLLRHNIGGLTLNQGVEVLENADLVASRHDTVEITPRGSALIG